MAAYPAINAAGIITQFPYTEEDEFIGPRASLDNGFAYTMARNLLPLKRFIVNYPLIQRAEITVLENFFNSMRARLGQFQFTDDAGTTWNKTRFDQDQIDVKYNEATSYSLTIHLSAQLN